MSADWKRLSRDAALHIDGDALVVPCGGERTQRVFVEAAPDDALRLWSIVVRHRDAPENAAINVWRINCYRELVGFKIAEYGRLIGESLVPTVGLTPSEWKLYVETLARACDRLEYLWTGRDSE